MEASEQYDTIILDLGGVLINVDYTASARAFAQLGYSGFDDLFSKSKQDGLFDRFETGAITPAQFRDRIRQLSQLDLTDAQIDGCWNAMLGSIPQERIALVKQLKERYEVLLLSNTNAIHVPAFEAIAAKEHRITDFKGLFDGAHFSCELGMRKPNADIFAHVLSLQGADAKRTLFIDASIDRKRVV